MYAIGTGLLASLFFAVTFVLNHAMELAGGNWMWSASLRFWFMAPMLLLLVTLRGQLFSALRHLRQNAGQYLLWSTVGFGLFYAPLTFSASLAPGWLVAGSWQLTIIAGSLLSPLISQTAIPWRGLRWSLLILLGIALMLCQQADYLSSGQILAGFLPVLLAAFMYPLGNRKMMQVCQQQADTLQRVLNMTLASLPFWFLLSVIALCTHGLPATGQVGQSLCVALFSGVIATLLFFAATTQAQHDPQQLAAVEATQAGELLFTLSGEMMWSGIALPSGVALSGIALVMAGMVAHSLFSGSGVRGWRKGK